MAEFEVRIGFSDPNKVEKEVLARVEIGAEYDTEDQFFQPKGANWSLSEKNMRLRSSTQKNGDKSVDLIYRENVWHGDTKEEIVGLKIPFENVEAAKKVLQNWNFEKIFGYKKHGKVLKFTDGKSVYWEQVEHLGVTVEIEAENQEEIDECLKMFNKFDYKLLKGTVAEMVMAKLNGS